MDDWLYEIDFSLFPGQMISGLEINEINEVLRDNAGVKSSDPKEKGSSDPVKSSDHLNSSSEKSDHLAQKKRDRFGECLNSEEIDVLNQEGKSKNTIKRNRWAYKILTDWLEQRNIDIDFQNTSTDQLGDVMARFIHEARRSDGQRYQGATLVSIVAGIQNTLSTNEKQINFFNDNKFRIVKESLDTAMKLSAKLGCNLPRRSAGVINLGQEEMLWKKCFGNETPDQLIDTLFYLNGIHFALRGGEEHSMLTMDQFKLETRNGKKCLIYTEKCSKNNSGGLRNVRHQIKEVVQFESDNKTRCHVALFEKFQQVRPNDTNRFYIMPKKNCISLTWFTNRPIGKNKLAGFMKRISEKAGVPHHVTNHSLRATCATRLYEANVDEQLIMERTGHRSLNGVRAYKRTSDIHLEQCSAVLDGKLLHQVQPKYPKQVSGEEPHPKVNVFISNSNVTIYNTGNLR